MVIFHTDHWGAIAHYIVLAVTEYKDAERILICTDVLNSREKILNNFVRKNIFNKIITDINLKHPGANLKQQSDIQRAVIDTIDRVLDENNISISVRDTVYSATDIDGLFRYYLMMKRIKYNHLMIAVNDIYDNSKNNELYNIGIATKEYMALVRENHIHDGQSPWCEKIIAFPGTEIKNNRIKQKIIRYDLVEKLESLNDGDAEKILECFGMSIESLGAIKCMLLSNSEGYLWSRIAQSGYNGRDQKEHTLLYQLLIDFYSRSNINQMVIKPHPNNYVDWGKYFNGIPVLNKNMPIELILLSKSCYLEDIVGLQTTAIDKIQKRVRNEIFVGIDFAYYYHAICRLYVICECYKKCQLNIPLHEYGFSNSFFTSFINYAMDASISDTCVDDDPEYKGSIFKIYRYIDSMTFRDARRAVQNLDNKSIIGVLSIVEENPIYRLIKNCYPIVLRIIKKALKSEIVLPLQDEYVLLFTKSPILKEKLQGVRVDKTLEITGVQLHAETLTDFETELFFEKINQHNEMKALNRYVQVLTDSLMSNGIYSLKGIFDFETYLANLRMLKDVLIFIAIKDNAGKNFTYTAVKYWKALGLKTDIDILGWNSYLAIIDNDKVIYEVAGQREDPSEYCTTFDGIEVKMYSKSYNKGNLASILFDGKECAVNGRGINIVVYDKLNRQICDSVAFDTFLPVIKCSRKQF